MKRIAFITFFVLFCVLSVYSQTFKVESIKADPFDISAQSIPRNDINGVACGLLKVRCVLDNVTFKGNVMGEVTHKDGEYWVYLTNGTKFLAIHHPKLLPLSLNFPEELGDAIQSSSTYILVLSIPEALYNAELNNGSNQSSVSKPSSFSTALSQSQIDNRKIQGQVTDEHGEELIGCTVMSGDNIHGTACDIDGRYWLDMRSNNDLKFSYIGYKTKIVTFTGKIPPVFDVSLKEGRGTERVEYFYDPNDTSEYFDLKGNKLPSRPTKKGTYIQIKDGKPQKLVIN